MKSSHQPETRPVLRAHGLQLGIGLPRPAKDFKDLGLGGAGMGFDLICWIRFSGFQVSCQDACGIPKKQPVLQTKLQNTHGFSDLIGLILCRCQEMVLSSGYKPSELNSLES